METHPSDDRRDAIDQYVAEAPSPNQTGDDWTGSEGEDPSMAGVAIHSGGGRVSRSWLNLDREFEIAYAVSGEGDEIGSEPVTIEVNKLSSSDPYASRATVETVSAPNDEAALEEVDSLVSRVESGEFDG